METLSLLTKCVMLNSKTTILSMCSTGAHTCIIVIKATDLINVSMRSCKISLQSMHVLGETYFLIHPSHQWIYDARDRCYDDGVTFEKLLSLNSDKPFK